MTLEVMFALGLSTLLNAEAERLGPTFWGWAARLHGIALSVGAAVVILHNMAHP